MQLDLSVTLVIVIVTVIVSLIAFNNNKVMGDLIFDPTRVSGMQQYYRFFTSGFIHADYAHLAFNMISLYMFGRYVEVEFMKIFGGKGQFLYALMYLAALYASLMPTYQKNKHNQYYLGLGASGAVSAVIFAGLLLTPTIPINLYFIPIDIPGFIFGPLYIVFSIYLEKRGKDNINHSAHIWGSIFGLAFVLFTCYVIAKYPVIQQAATEIRWWMVSKGILSP
jgi:membrane associated rhomboid family serine protease